MKSKRPCGYTLIELVATIVVLILLSLLVVVIFATAQSGKRITPPIMQSNTQIRGIHQAMVMYSQSNRTKYPGIGEDGDIVDASVEYRFQELLEGNYFTGEYAISPAETKTVWTTGKVTSANYSYAMLDIDGEEGGRTYEWQDTINDEAVVMSDRNTGPDAAAKVQSLHSDEPGEWEGSVVYNDNHVRVESTHILPTKYGPAALNPADNLFASDSPDDALMIHSGQ